MEFIAVALLALAGLFDRIRGGYPEGRRPKWMKYLVITLIGPIMALQISYDPLVLGLSILIGHIIWRQDNGYKGRFVVTNPKYDLIGGIQGAARWGLLASIPFLCLGWLDSSFYYAPIPFAIGNIASHLVAMKLPATQHLQLRNAWPWSELISLPIIGIGLCLLP